MSRTANLELPVSLPAKMPAINTIKIFLHLVQILCTVITVCVVAPIIAAENRFYGGSQPGPNWTLFVCLASLVVPICLVVFPWMYDQHGKFRRLGKFCMKPRTNLIFTSFYTGFWATAGIAMTVHANNPSHCNLDSSLQKKYGDDYMSTWTSQCTCGRVAAGFSWTTCILWLLSLGCTLIIFWREKQLIQKNLKQHEMNKQAVLQMQQQQQQQEEDDFDEEPRETYRPAGYYEEEEEDLGGMRPQSFEQARPLQSSPPPPPAVPMQHQPTASPFESPYDPPQPYPGQYATPVQYPTPEQQYQQQQPSPFDDYPHQTEPAYTTTSPPPPQPTAFTPMPMPMPEPSQYTSRNHF